MKTLSNELPSGLTGKPGSEDNLFRRIMEISPVAILVADGNGRITHANAEAERLLHITKEQLSLHPINLSDWQLTDYDGRRFSEDQRPFRRVIASGHAVQDIHLVLRGPQDERRLLSVSMAPVLDPSGEVSHVVASLEDITERVEAEKILRESEENFRNLFENAPVGVFQSNFSRLLSVNPALARMFGYESSVEMVNSSSDAGSFFVRPEQRTAMLREATDSNSFVQQEVEYYRKDGSTFYASLRMRVEREAAGETQVVQGFVEDITERKRLETELALREQRLNSFFHNATAGLCIVDADLRYVQINETLARLNGLPADQHPGKTVREVLPKLAPLLEPVLQRVLDTGEPALNMELRGETTRDNKEIHHWIASYFPSDILHGKCRAVGCVVVDITEQKRAEENLRESEEKFRQLAENIHKVFWICDRYNSKMLYVSPAYEEIWGATCQSLYDRPSSFIEAIHSEDRPRIQARLKRHELGADYEEEYRIVRPDGSIRWIHDRGFIVRNEQGEFYRRAGLAEDITQRRVLEMQFIQSQKMEAVGALAGGIAHDFNNILAATLMQLGLLQLSPQLTMGIKESLKEMEKETMRAANLTRQLLLFGRRQTANVETVDLNSLIGDLLKMLRRLLSENIDMAFQRGSEEFVVRADPGMMEQVVMNLSINARDAMPRGGKLILTVSSAHLGSETTKLNPASRPGHFVCLTVTDNGCGMDEATQKRIFEPFFTTKKVGEGSGLGLASVYGIIKQHEGWVEVESAVGKGTSFRVYLPAHAGVSPRNAAFGEEEVKGGTETILFVEDDLSLRRLGAMCLRKLGYALLEAEDGAGALTLWEKHHQRIDLLLSDMVMPEALTGLDLAKQFRKEKISLKVLITSGYSTDLEEPRAFDQGATSYLPKPYNPATLARVVRRCLNAS